MQQIPVFLLNDKFFIWSPQGASMLRNHYRILGEYVGSLTRINSIKKDNKKVNYKDYDFDSNFESNEHNCSLLPLILGHEEMWFAGEKNLITVYNGKTILSHQDNKDNRTSFRLNSYLTHTNSSLNLQVRSLDNMNTNREKRRKHPDFYVNTPDTTSKKKQKIFNNSSFFTPFSFSFNSLLTSFSKQLSSLTGLLSLFTSSSSLDDPIQNLNQEIEKLPNNTTIRIASKQFSRYLSRFYLVISPTFPNFSIYLPQISISEWKKILLSLNDQLFLTRCSIFASIWSKNLILSQGLNFGGDFLVYCGPPSEYHSHLIIRATGYYTKIRVSTLVGLCRVANDARKSLVCASICDHTQNIHTNNICYMTISWDPLFETSKRPYRSFCSKK